MNDRKFIESIAAAQWKENKILAWVDNFYFIVGKWQKSLWQVGVAWKGKDGGVGAPVSHGRLAPLVLPESLGMYMLKNMSTLVHETNNSGGFVSTTIKQEVVERAKQVLGTDKKWISEEEKKE